MTGSARLRAAPILLASTLGSLAASSMADIRADLDRDGVVGGSDLGLMLIAWGPHHRHFADLDLDGEVGASDLAKLLGHWGSTFETAVFTPVFEVDYSGCGNSIPPTGGSGNAAFGTAASPHHAGRVVSTTGYRNITRIEADVDLSGVNDDFVNAAWYMVSTPMQPIGSAYCDSGGSAPACDEIDFLETNANAILQSTVHLDGDQRFEFAYTAQADTNCYGWSTLQSDAQNPTSGTHSLLEVVDVAQPFQMVIEFDLVAPRMTVIVSQTIGKKIRQAMVYDSAMVISPANSGGPDPDMSLLPATMATGWWILASMWQGYSPGQYNAYWTNACPWGSLCGGSSHWTLSNVKVTAESEFGR